MTTPDLLALLKRELWNDGEGHDAEDVAYRRGWNARAQALIKVLEAELTRPTAIGGEKR